MQLRYRLVADLVAWQITPDHVVLLAGSIQLCRFRVHQCGLYPTWLNYPFPHRTHPPWMLA
jgi:hypothetical protein